MEPFRLAPQGPAHAYQTYQILTPNTPEHWRPASCEDVACEHYLNGWQTPVPAGDEQMLYTVRNSGRPYTEVDGVFDGVRFFIFKPGTRCFRASQHQVKVGRPELFIVRGGDWRGNPTGAFREHVRPDDWVEDLQEHTGKIHDQREKG